MTGTQATIWKAKASTLLDVRPELEQGGEPFFRFFKKEYRSIWQKPQ